MASLAVIAGCNGGENGRSGPDGVARAKPAGADKSAARATADTPSKAKVKAWDAKFGTATVSGVAKFRGKPPKRLPIDMSRHKVCESLHAEPVLAETIIVNKNGTLRNVFVWVKRGLEGWKFPTPSEPVLLDQVGCMYRPHVLGAQTGQDILIRNSDPTASSIHALPKKNTGFAFTQSQKGMEDIRRFRKPEVMIKIICDVHSWESAYLGVVDHPYFATTGKDGKFELPNLPPGEFIVEAWHEELGTRIEKVTLKGGDAKVLEFTFGDK